MTFQLHQTSHRQLQVKIYRWDECVRNTSPAFHSVLLHLHICVHIKKLNIMSCLQQPPKGFCQGLAGRQEEKHSPDLILNLRQAVCGLLFGLSRMLVE